MFGYLAASPQLLSEEELLRYKSAYCGLCRTLKERHGQLSRITLNYDMVFLILLLNSLYEPVEENGEENCVVHPFEKRTWWKSEYTEYAADMNIALSYLKLQDDWRDDRKVSAFAAAGVLKKTYEEIKLSYPRQCAAMEQCIADLSKIENSGEEDPDGASLTFGRLMGEIFIYRDDRWKNLLYNSGCGLGRFVYLLDAVMDLDDDVRSGNYNPLKKYHELDSAEQERQFRDILSLFLGDAVSPFSALPLVSDASLLNNILCAGLWQSFENKYHPQKINRLKDRKE